MHSTIIGAGRLGKNIALALSKANISPIQSICNQSLDSSIQACTEVGSGIPLNNIAQLEDMEILWVTCSDDAIHLVVKQLVQHAVLKPGNFVIHCSGVLGSSVLSPLKDQGCSVASIHPLKAFKNGYLDAQAFNQVPCVLEGDEEVCHWLKKSFELLGAQIINIDPSAKASYHAAASMASNYLITLAACSEELLLNSGIKADTARQMICRLMQGNLNNLAQTKIIAQTLTGPLMRGDLQTLQLHLQSIDNPEIKKLYQSAGLATLSLTQLDDAKKQAIKTLLNA